MPGHGPVSTRADVEEALEVLTYARDRVQARLELIEHWPAYEHPDEHANWLTSVYNLQSHASG